MILFLSFFCVYYSRFSNVCQVKNLLQSVGARGETQTPDPEIKGLLLFQLSYTSMMFFGGVLSEVRFCGLLPIALLGQPARVMVVIPLEQL